MEPAYVVILDELQRDNKITVGNGDYPTICEGIAASQGRGRSAQMPCHPQGINFLITRLRENYLKVNNGDLR